LSEECPYARKLPNLELVRECKLDRTTCVGFRFYKDCPEFLRQERGRKKAAELYLSELV